MDGMTAARALLKAAAAREGARTLGKVLSGAIRGAGDIGQGLAEGAGASKRVQSAARVGAQGTAAYTGYAGGRRTKRKVDEWRYQNGLY